MARKTPTPPHQDGAMLLSEREVWTGAIAMIQRYGPDAVTEARMQLHGIAAADELDTQLAWLRIIEAILWLQDERPPRPALPH
jgi:hypothetical protein